MTTETLFKVDIEGARPNWIGSMSGRLHSRLPFPDAFDGGFDSYYSRRGQTVSGGYPRSNERRHFLNSFNPSSAPRLGRPHRLQLASHHPHAHLR